MPGKDACTVEDRLSRWKADKERRRGQLMSQQIEIEQLKAKAKKDTIKKVKRPLKKTSVAADAKKPKIPRTPIRSRLAEWRKRNEDKVPKTTSIPKPKAKIEAIQKPLKRTIAPKVDIIARNKMLAAKRRELPPKSDIAKRRDTFLVTQKKAVPLKPKVPAAVGARVSLTTKALQMKSTLSRTATIGTGLQTSNLQKNRRVTIAADTKKPVARFRNIPSRIDSGLKAIKRKSESAEQKTPQRRRVDVLRSLNTPKSCVRFKGTPELERNTPVRKEMSMREKLNSWLLSHGKTPSKFHHLLCMNDAKKSNEVVDGGLSVLDLNLQQQILDEESNHPEVAELNHSLREDDNKLDKLLNEIESLTNEGCPATTLGSFMDGIANDYPSCMQSAVYWVRRADVVKATGDQDAVLSVFDEAVEHHAQPAEVIAGALQRYVSETMIGKATPGKENAFLSSVVKYCYANTKSTPFFKKYRPSVTEPHTPSALITPVRRSTRKSHLGLPMMLQDHDVILESLDDLHQNKLCTALFVPNRALALSDEETE